MRTIDRDGFGPAVRDDSENLKLYLARRVQQRTAKFRCRCYRRAGTWSSFDRGEKNAATAATAATATTDFDTEKRRETGSSTDLDAHGARKPAVRLAMMKSAKSVSRSSISNGYVMAI